LGNDCYWKNIEDIAKRQRTKGIRKYGFTLENNDVLNTVETLTYLQEELIDALMYCEHIKHKLKENE
jgi:tagatose-1,6-bisphosphate aldolase